MILYQQRIVRADLKANPSVLYCFGDNLLRIGFGGQAKEMRGEPNAIGIPTKRGPHIYFRDADFDHALAAIKPALLRLEEHLMVLGGVIVFPADGIGTGLANLPAQAPRIWTYLNAKLSELGIEIMGDQMVKERMLDLIEARQWLEEHGMPYSYRQVQRMASDHKLPFRPGPDGRRLFVPMSALEKLLEPGPQK